MVEPSELNYFKVGGAVRDRLLGREANDIDYVIVGESVEDMLSYGFEQVHVGNNEQVVFLDVDGIIEDRAEGEEAAEIALARREQSTGEGYNDFEFEVENVSLREDLRRRDLTINAMAEDPDTGEVIDPFGGQEDLEAGVVRHVSEAFAEDPLRVIRAARFAARFDFEVADETLDLMGGLAPKLEAVANERISGELVKAMKQAESPRRFFDVLLEVGALEVFLPELAELANVPAGPEEYHGEGSAYEHSMRVLENMSERRPGGPRALLAAAFHDIGKVETDEDVLPHHYEHEKVGKQVARGVADRLEMSNELMGVMESAARYHGRVHDIEDLRASTLLRMTDSLRDDYEVSNPEDEPTVAHLKPAELVDLGAADSAGREPAADFDAERVQAHFDAAEQVLDEITGQDVLEQHDIEEGPKVSEVLLQDRVERLKELRSGL